MPSFRGFLVLVSSSVVALAEPAAPTTPQLSYLSQKQVRFTGKWTGATNAVSALKLCQATPANPGKCVYVDKINFSAPGSPLLQTLDYVLEDALTPSKTLKTYHYQVVAFDRSGTPKPIAFSNVTKAQIQFGAPDVTVDAVSKNSLQISWQSQSYGHSGFQVERKDGSKWIPIGLPGPTASSYVDPNRTTTTTYRVKVIGAGVALASHPATGTPGAPNAPIALAAPADQRNATEIGLTWKAGTGGQQGFQIERALVGTNDFQTLGTSMTEGYRDSGLSAATGYTYRVKSYALSANGIKALSDGVTLAAVYTSPPPPSDLRCIVTTPRSNLPNGMIQVTWKAPTVNVPGAKNFQVRFFRQGVPTLSSSSTHFTDTSIIIAQPVTYGVQTSIEWPLPDGTTGVSAGPSVDKVSCSTQAPVMSSVNGLSAVAFNNGIALSWPAQGTFADRYEIERRNNSTNAIELFTVHGGTTASVLNPAPDATRLFYKIRSCLGAYCSPQWRELTNPLWMVQSKLAVPDGFQCAYLPGTHEMELTWAHTSTVGSDARFDLMGGKLSQGMTDLPGAQSLSAKRFVFVLGDEQTPVLHQFRLRARATVTDSFGVENYVSDSVETSCIQPPSQPAPPQILEVSYAWSQSQRAYTAHLIWAGAARSYVVREASHPTVELTSSTCSIGIPGLQPSTSQTYLIIASNSGMHSEATPVTLAVPAAPAGSPGDDTGSSGGTGTGSSGGGPLGANDGAPSSYVVHHVDLTSPQGSFLAEIEGFTVGSAIEIPPERTVDCGVRCLRGRETRFDAATRTRRSWNPVESVRFQELNGRLVPDRSDTEFREAKYISSGNVWRLFSGNRYGVYEEYDGITGRLIAIGQVRNLASESQISDGALRTTFHYSAGFLESVQQDGRSVLDLEYDHNAAGGPLLTKVTEHRSSSLRFTRHLEYNAARQVIFIRGEQSCGSQNCAALIQWGPHGPTTIADSWRKFSVHALYGADGKVLKVANQEGESVAFSYPSPTRVKVFYPSVEGSAPYEQYDFTPCPSGLCLAKLSNQRGEEFSYTYDDTGLVSSVTEKNLDVGAGSYVNRATSFSRDQAGRVIEIERTGGVPKVRYEYDDYGFGLVKSRTEGPLKMSYDISPDGLVLAVKRNGVPMGTTAYGASGLLDSVTTYRGTIRITRDESGRPISAQDGKLPPSTYGYDESGRLTEAAFPDGSSVMYSYDQPDGDGFVDTSTFNTPDGPSQSYGEYYDKDGTSIGSFSPEGKTVLSRTDSGLKMTVTDAANNSIETIQSMSSKGMTQTTKFNGTTVSEGSRSYPGLAEVQ